MTALDGLRGVVVTIVVLRYTLNALALPADVRRSIVESPFAPLFNAPGAVQLFFMLSAFVLAMSLARDKGVMAIAGFYAKRLLRIQPAYIGALLFAWAASFFYVQTEMGDGLTLWLRQSAEVHLTFEQLATSIALTGPAFGQLPVGWTLRIELLFSFLLPVLVLLARHAHWLVLVALSLFALSLGHDWQMLWYGFDFALGVLLFQYRETITGAIRTLPTPVAMVLLIASVAAFASPLLLGWSRPALGTLVAGLGPRPILFMGVGAFGILVCALSRAGVARVLSTRPLRYLGRISLSLYLVNRTVLVLLAPVVTPPVTWVDGIVLLGLVMGVSIAAAELLYRVAEAPGIALGLRITARMRQAA